LTKATSRSVRSHAEPAKLRARQRIAATIAEHAKRRFLRLELPRTYYLQSKQPDRLGLILGMLPREVVLVTTLETNRDEGYDAISKAPRPSFRVAQFKALDWPRKVLTLEPLMDFDTELFADMIASVEPEYVWLGFNSRPKQVALPEPSPEKVLALVARLHASGIDVRGKDTRGLL